MVDTELSLWDITGNRQPDGHEPPQFYRLALAQGQAYLKHQFEQQADIIELIHQRSSFVDQVLQQLWSQFFSTDEGIALLAVGGYGRGELHPFSDIDLLVLVDESISEQPPLSLSDFLTQLWDIGLEIGHSVRTIKECRQQAEHDITIATNLLETRCLCGDEALYLSLKRLTVANKTWDTKLFYQAKVDEQKQRHQKYNNTANNLEPNIKESPGGFRDLQVISWIAQQHFSVKDLHGLNQKGFIEDYEFQILEKAQRFLWRVRFVLHMLAGRKQEKLMIDYQREIAKQLGYEDSENRLAVEHFMKDYYRCARSVGQMNALLVQLFEENIILADEPREIAPINRRFQVHNGYLETINPGIFAFYPYAMLELFLVLQQHPEVKGVRADTIRQLHSHLHLINHKFRHDIKNRSLFMEIIRQPKGITHEFRRMNQFGVLGQYLPSFGQIVGQMQHDLFHAYTVDEHTLFLVGNLRRFSCDEFRDEFPLCSEVFYQLPKPELLYIAGLFHDIAKGRGGDHSKLGVVDAKAFCEQHSLSEFDTGIVTFLVRHHLLMSATAQRYDIDDPNVIEKFANQVKTVDKLAYLYLLTIADIRATNDNLWNGWRDSLLKQLYHSTRSWLINQEKSAKELEQKSEQQRQIAQQLLLDKSWSMQQIQALWNEYDPDYFLRHNVDEIIWQTEQRLRNTSSTLIALRNYDQHNTQEIFIVTQDKQGIFAAITSALEQLQLDIFDAKINTVKNGELLNTFIVNGPSGHQKAIQSAIQRKLDNLGAVSAYCPVHTPRKMKLFETEPKIHFRVNADKNHTVLELKTHDRPGLVSTIAQVFLQCDIELINAKLTTLGDQVEDTFFISTREKAALTPEQQKQLYDALITGLNH